ncbi:hypothetical protein [Kitasatospora sp. NPDC088548]|uniref:hypothetical protein n=1 Tax=Kitasatospora sp. NPDC088548 TaxID=3364075 RepID=UPI00381CBB62
MADRFSGHAELNVPDLVGGPGDPAGPTADEVAATHPERFITERLAQVILQRLPG